MDKIHNSKIENSLVSIVILNYNGKDYLEECIESVFKTKNCNFEVILVDNASTDNSARECLKKFPQIRLFENNVNLAMAARNIGIDNAKGNYIVFLDSDATVDPYWLENFVQSFLIHGEGLYQGKILDKDNSEIIGSGGNLLNIFFFGYARGNNSKDIGQYEKFESISFPVGACMFSSLETIKKIGRFDESNLLFLMFDDVDYGLKALTIGIFSYYEPKSIVYHISSTASKLNQEKMFLMDRNRWICLLSYYSNKTILKLIPSFIIIEFGLFLFLISKGMPFVKFKVLFSLMRLFPRIIKRKKFTARRKTLHDSEIIKHLVDEVVPPESLTTKKFQSLILTKISQISRKII